MRPSPLATAAALLLTACAGGSAGPAPASTPTPAPAPAPAAATVMQRAAQAEPPKPKEVDLSGRYAVSLTYGGAPLSVVIQIGKREDGTYAGVVTADQAQQPIPLNSVTVTGKRVQATLSSPDGSAVTLDFTIDGDDLAGTWAASSGDGSPISGKKIP